MKLRDLPSSSRASNVFSTVDNDDPPAHAKHEIEEDPNKQQKTMLDYQILDNKTLKAYTEAIATFIETCMQSYATAEHPKFIQMIKTLNPGYKFTGRKHFSTVVIPKLNNNVVEKVKRLKWEVLTLQLPPTVGQQSSILHFWQLPLITFLKIGN